MSYPDYPQAEELRDWNSELLTLDGYIAGYATRIKDGSIKAGAVPDLDGLISQVDALRRDLDSLNSRVKVEGWLLEEYRSYISALYRLVVEIGSMVDSERK